MSGDRLFVAFGSLPSATAGAARLIFALARDGFEPKALARTSQKIVAPTTATLTVAGLALALTVLPAAIGGGPVEVYYWYATIATLCLVVAYGMTSIGVIRYTSVSGDGLVSARRCSGRGRGAGGWGVAR